MNASSESGLCATVILWAIRSVYARRRQTRYDPRVSAFDMAAILLAIAAACGYLNHRFLHLPATSGTLAVALFSSLAILGMESFVPSWQLREEIRGFIANIDFNQTLMR